MLKAASEMSHSYQSSKFYENCLPAAKKSFKPFSKRQFLEFSKLKKFDNDNSKFDDSGRQFFKWIENSVGKAEIAPIPTVFSKDLYCRHVKTRACLGKS